ncbi:MAG: TonB-dependent receptor [Planctomycetota bacterium]|nr:TonB-dependent receptor [Planctomycetota bacterium]
MLLALPQDAPASESFVYAPRSETVASAPAANVSTVLGDDLRATGKRSLAKALEVAAGPGVWVQETNMGGGSAFIRGLTGNQVLIMVDGVRLNDSTTRFGPNQVLNTIDPAIVERIEVTRGPSSVLYGSDAIGGVISIFTRRMAPLGGDGSQDGGNFGAADATLDLALDSSVMGGRLSPVFGFADSDDGYLFVASFYDYNDLNTGGPGKADATAYHGESAFGSWDKDYGDGTSWRASAWIHRDMDVPRTDKLVAGYGQANPKNDVYDFALQDRRSALMAFSDTTGGLFGDEFQLRFSLRRYEERRIKQGFASTRSTFERDETETVGIGMDWKRAIGDAHLLTYGLDLDFDRVSSIRRDTETTTGVVTPKDGQFAPDAEYLAMGLFIQDEIFAFDDYDVTVGARFSAYSFSFDGFGGGADESGNFNSLTTSLQVGREVAPGHRLTATLAQGFRAPNLDDLAKDGDFGGGTELPNADLDPEQSLTAELAYGYRAESFSLDGAVFGTEIRDVVGRRLTDEGVVGVPGDETYLRDNAGDVRLFGVEFAAEKTLGNGPYSVDAGLAFVRGRQHDDTFDAVAGEAPFDGVDWRRVPPLHGTAGINWRPALGREVAGVRVDEARFGIDWADTQDKLHPGDKSDARINPNGTAGWARFDLDVFGPLGHTGDSRWSLGLHNLFDANYRIHGSGVDAPGLTLAVGLHWSL